MTKEQARQRAHTLWSRSARGREWDYVVGDRWPIARCRRKQITDRFEVGYSEATRVRRGQIMKCITVILGRGPTWEAAFEQAETRRPLAEQRDPFCAYKSHCEACLTPAGCGLHKLFTCATCRRTVAWVDGGSEERYKDDCSDCWLAAQPTGGVK